MSNEKIPSNSAAAGEGAGAGTLALRVLWTFAVKAIAGDTTHETERRFGPELLIAVLALALVLVV